MSRNRGTTECDCGRELRIEDAVTRPLTFYEYLKLSGVRYPTFYRYWEEYRKVIGVGVICPDCGTPYFMWIGGIHIYRDNMKTVEDPVKDLDTSYWESFDDEHGSEWIKQR